MSETLTLRPLLLYVRDDPLDYFYTAPRASDRFQIPDVPGYVYNGIAFMVSTEPATVADGTELIPLYEYILPDGRHFYTVYENEGRAAGVPSGVTFYVLPDTTDYGALLIRRYRASTPPGDVHCYTVDEPPPPGWVLEGAMGCAVPAAKVHVGLTNGVVSTAMSSADGTRRADAEISVYPSRGSMIVFACDSTDYTLDKLRIVRLGDGADWALDLTRRSSVPGCPFEVVGTWASGNGAYVLDEHDEGSTTDLTYEYTVTVRQGDATYSHDPKVINRSGTTTQPVHIRRDG